MELWHLYDSELNLVKTKHPSTEPIPDGQYHLSIEVWLFDGQAFFLTRRSMAKKMYPGFWECIGGKAIGAESFEEAAVRELREEIGYETRPDALIKLAQEVRDHHIVAVFLLPVEERCDFTLNRDEVIEGKWLTVQQVESLHLDTSFVPHQFDRYLRYVRVHTFSQYIDSKPDSVRRLMDVHPELRVPKRGLPHSGTRPDGKPFSPGVNEIFDAFDVYGEALYSRKTLLPENVNNSLGSGSPLNCRVFPPIANAIEQMLRSTALSMYPFPAGDIGLRRGICEYLYQEGFSHLITPENIIFTMSTTHAFNMILKMILRPGDVVLFTAPTYGLFAFGPELRGGESHFIELSAEDDWLVDPDKLECCILEKNAALQAACGEDCKDSPRVVAFFNENPHNPTGKVMGRSQRDRLKRIAAVCRRSGVLLIDDLIYRDLGYDREDLAIPVASFDDEYQNTVSLLGLSKSYGVAGMRAGLIVADEVIIRGIRDTIFQEVDSSSHLNTVALAAAFSASDDRNLAYQEYFTDIIYRYRFNFALIRAAVDGLDAVDGMFRAEVASFVKKQLGVGPRAEWWLSGMEPVHFIDRLIPESGFFCILDFSELRGKTADGITIEDDISLLIYLFHRYRVNFITGKSMGWPNKEQIVARISYSVESQKIVDVFAYMKSEIERLI